MNDENQTARVGARRLPKNALAILMLLITPLMWVGFRRIDDRLEQRFVARFGADGPNIFFNSRIRPGMTAEQVSQAVPRPEAVNFFEMQDASIVEQLLYDRPLSADYQVNIVLRGKRVAFIEFDDRDLGQLKRLSDREGWARTR